jgi:LAO/AO transport system kinase
LTDTLNIVALKEEILKGNKVALAKAITLVESNKPSHRQMADNLINALLPYSGNSLRIGITGVPGVGKSTFIEVLGIGLIEKYNKKVAVLAIDPSSNLSGGSILGDKTRMNVLSTKSEAFIRPSPSRGFLGGVAHHTRETIVLCEAAGFDYILVETVGVGQSEVAVSAMVDVFVLLMLPGAGDELQGIKRGIMELADILVINKAEGELLNKAKEAAQNYQMAQHLFPNKSNNWITQVVLTSALNNEGIEYVISLLEKFKTVNTENGSIQSERSRQNLSSFNELIRGLIEKVIQEQLVLSQLRIELESKIEQGKINPYEAANLLVNQLKVILKNS